MHMTTDTNGCIQSAWMIETGMINDRTSGMLKKKGSTQEIARKSRKEADNTGMIRKAERMPL
jgi:hypothetical protein